MKKFDARDLSLDIDRAELVSLYKTSSLKHGAAIGYNWAIIIASIWLCTLFFNPFSYILTVIIIGARIHALGILMHDATHFRFLKNKRWNDILTNILTMYPIFTSIEGYRQNHLRHHRHLNTDDDPDWVAKVGRKDFTFPKTKREFILTLLSYFTLYKGISDALWIFSRFKVPTQTEQRTFYQKENTPLKIGFYLALITALTVFGGWKLFLIFWVVPYFSTFFMFQYIRSVSEHFGDLEYDDLLSSTRSVVKVNLFEQFFIAPHNVGYHLEHHLYPQVPFYNLPELHNMLMGSSEYADKAHLTHGYMTGLLNDLGQIEKMQEVSRA